MARTLGTKPSIKGWNRLSFIDSNTPYLVSATEDAFAIEKDEQRSFRTLRGKHSRDGKKPLPCWNRLTFIDSNKPVILSATKGAIAIEKEEQRSFRTTLDERLSGRTPQFHIDFEHNRARV